MPWSLFANKNSVLLLGDWNDEDSDDTHNDDDDFRPDKSYGDTDSSEDEYTDETEIGGTRFETAPVRQACESNQYGEMLGKAAQFGKPFLAHEDQEQQTVDTSKGPAKDTSNNTSYHPGTGYNRLVSSSAFDISGTSRDGAVSDTTIRNSDSGIPGTSSVSSSRGITAATNDSRQEMKQVH